MGKARKVRWKQGLWVCPERIYCEPYIRGQLCSSVIMEGESQSIKKFRVEEIKKFVLNNIINKLNFLREGKGIKWYRGKWWWIVTYRNRQAALKLKALERKKCRGREELMTPVRESSSFGSSFRREEKDALQVTVFHIFRSGSRDERRKKKDMTTIKEEIHSLINAFHCYFSQTMSFY